MFAAGGAGDTDRFKGYRIWPRLGFDGVIPRKSITPTWSLTTGFFNSYGSSIPNRILSPRAISEKKAGKLTIQALYETKEGQDWWEENGGPMEMDMTVGDKKSPGWQRFLAMRDKATRRSISNDEFFDWLDFEWRHIVEQRAFCATGKGKGVDNSCSSKEKSSSPAEEGGGSKSVSQKGKPSEESGSLKWKSGDSHPDAFSSVQQSPPMSRTADGKMTSREYSRENKEITPFAGQEFASPESVARYLRKTTQESRGREINTRKPLAGDEFEYMASSLSQQVTSAQSRGHAPLFYSQEELKAQTDHYTQIHPVLKGGMTASGLCIGKLNSSGDCEQTDSITPEGEFLFRAVQALTSPQANPDLNMQRADRALTHFLTEPDPNLSGLDKAPYFNEAQKNAFAKLQRIIDKVGLDGAANIFSGPPVRAGDIEKLFEELGISGVSATKQYAADEMVPIFSVFGPKVGPFFANNTGNLEHLTADVWFTRTWGRLSGELLKDTNKDLAKKHAKELLKPSMSRHLSDEDLAGTPKDELIAGLQHMQKTGEIPAVVEGWATARFKRFGKEGFATGTEKKFGKQYAAVGNLSRAVFNNLLHVNDTPESTVQRSNMIKVMKEVSKRTGLPVAYCQDLLWQDEQDVWGAAGARTFTEVGEASLYSTGIQKMVTDPTKRKPVTSTKPASKKKPAKRSIDDQNDDRDVVGVGDFEQMAFDDDIQDVDADEFANAFIKLFGGESEAERRNFAALDFGIAAATAFVGRVAESFGVRAFCPNGEGNGVSNECGGGERASLGNSMPKSKYDDARNKTSWLSPSGDFHPVDRSKDIGSSGGGNTHDDWALAHGVSGGEASLHDDGWIRVTNSGRTLHLSTYPGFTLSQKQASSAKDFAIASGLFDEVVFDTGLAGKKKTVWSSGSPNARAFCPTGDGGGVDNSCSADDSAGSPQLHAASERLTPQDLEKMISDDGKASRSVEGSMKLLKSKRRFELVGALTQSMPVDSVDAGDFSSKTVASAAPKGKSVSGSLSREIADAVEGIYGDLIRTANEQKAPRSLAIKDAALKSACFVSQMAAGVKEYPDILDSPVHVMRGTDIFDRMIDDGLGVAEAAKAAQHAAAMYSGTDDIIIVNADAGIGYINSVLAAAASVKNEETGEWESVSGGVPFYSTSQLGHSIAHENAHLLHYRAVRTELGLPHGKKLEKDEMLILASSLKIKCVAVMSHIGANPEVGEKLKAISGYAMTNPLETVAEYYTALALGVAKRDSDIDEVMVILGFPKDKLPAGKKGKKQ
jgi:hypothetical protein